MAIDKTTYAAAKKYTDTTVLGGGAIKGKNCIVDSIMAITGGNRVTFKWTLDNGTVQTNYMDVMDGADGLGIASVDIDSTNNHLIITYDDGTTHDAGEIEAQGQTIQRNVLPEASEEEAGKIYQYIGATDSNYTNGYFYECVLKDGNYIWENKAVQPGASGVIDTELNKTSHNAVENMAIAVPIEALQGSMANVKLDITQLQGSMLNVKADIGLLQGSQLALKTAVDNLDLLMASKVDKVPGKGLSTEDFTAEEKEKLSKLPEIYTIGSGLNLDGTVLSATGIAIPIDTQLDEDSPNPVQNKAIAVPVQALQGSMANVKLDVDQLKASDVSLKLRVQQLEASMPNKAAKSDVDQIRLDVQQLQGSMTNVKLDVDQLKASDVSLKLRVSQLEASMPNKADLDDLDEWAGTSTVDSNGDITFDDLDDSLNYDVPYFQNKFVSIKGMTKGTGTAQGTIKLTYHTDGTNGLSGKLRIIK